MNKVGVDIGGTSVKFSLLDENSVILKKDKIRTNISSPQGVANDIAELIKKNSDDYKSIPIGVACAGEVNAELGTVTADNLGWNKVNLLHLLQNEINRDVCLAQDAEAAMLAEWDCGSLKGESNAVFLTIGTGIGGSLIIDGKPYRQIKYNACEIGHMITHANGRECPCGEFGCYERYASASALVASTPVFDNAFDLFEAAMAKDERTLPIWDEYINEVCIGIVNMISIFAPDAISIGGGMSGSGEPFLNEIMKGLSNHLYYLRYGKSTKILLAKYGNEAGVRGAATAAMLKMGDNQVEKLNCK